MTFSDISVDAVQEYWNNRPCNLHHSKKEVGTKEYFDEVEKRKYFVEPHIPEFANFQRWEGKNVLEIGSGIGTDTVNFARAGANVTTVDLSEESLRLAQKRIKLYGYSKNVTFYRANAEKLSNYVPVKRYDLIYSFGVIHHTPHPERVIAEIKKYMEPGTSLFKMMVYHRYSWKVLGIILKLGYGAFWNADKLIAKYSEAQTGCPVTYSYTKRSVHKLLDGFTCSSSIRHIFPYIISEYTQYRYKKRRIFRMMSPSFFQWLEHHFGWHLCVNAMLN